MNIGSVSIPSPLALAPMAGVTDLAFRTVCRELGAGYTVTEMASAKALCYQDKKTLPLLTLGKAEHPAAVQLFGCDEGDMEKAAGRAAEYSPARAAAFSMSASSQPKSWTAAGCSPLPSVSRGRVFLSW